MLTSYGVGVDHPERGEAHYQTDSLAAAYMTAGLKSFGGTAVVMRFEDDGHATMLAIYRDGKPEPLTPALIRDTVDAFLAEDT